MPVALTGFRDGFSVNDCVRGTHTRLQYKLSLSLKLEQENGVITSTVSFKKLLESYKLPVRIVYTPRHTNRSGNHDYLLIYYPGTTQAAVVPAIAVTCGELRIESLPNE